MSAWFYLFQQTAGAWSLLLSLGLCMGLRRASLLRLSLSALACGGVSLLCALGDRLALRIAGLLIVTIAAPIGAWPGIPRFQRRRMILCCLMLSLLMAGCARLLHTLGLNRLPLTLAQFALLAVLIHLAPTGGHASCITLRITHGDRRLELTALVDTGNMLRDPITRLPVIVISRRAALRLIPDAQSAFPGMRLISVRTVAGSSLMPVFRPQSVRLLLPGGWRDTYAIIGLSPDGYSGFQALIPASLTTTPQGGMSLCP